MFDEGCEARSNSEADHAALGLLWRHHQSFAEDVSTQPSTDLFGKPPTAEELRHERSRWVHKLMGYPEPLRAAVATNCETLHEVADRSCPTPLGGQR